MRSTSRLAVLRRFRTPLVAVVIVLAAASAGLVYAHGSTAAAQYRTSTATLGTIRQTLSLTGNLVPVSQSNVAFAVSGTVTAVDVSAGQTVSAGQVLATVDPTTLRTTLAQAQATLAAGQARQTADEASSSSSTAAQQVASAQTALSSDQIAYTDTVAVNNQTIATDRQAITTATTAVAADTAAVGQDQATYAADGCTTTPTSPACTTDSQALSTAQQQQTKDQQSLSTAQATLPADMVRTRQSTDQAAAKVASDRTGLTNAEAASSSSSTAASQAATLAQDRATVAQAQQAVVTAQDAVTNATLTSPIAGQVAEVNTAVGSSVAGTGTSMTATGASATSATSATSSTSSTGQFVILTPGSFEVTGTVSDSVVGEVAAGERAVVTPAGATTGLPATVSSVGVVATVSSGVATFAVTVQITGTHPSLRDGMSATVTVIVNELVGVLTVPTSAVHTNGTVSTVQVMRNGAPTAVVVTLGSADPLRTQITSGLTEGDTVVIATVTGSVPSTTSGGAARRALGGGGFAAPGGGG